MMKRLFANKKQLLMFALLAALAFIVFRMCNGKRMFYQGKPIEIREKETKKLHELESSADCIETGYYTRGLEPKAICKGQETVNGHMSYEIVSGIGSD